MSPVAGRGNGLSAATYAALADVEPQLADVLLEVFRDEGIAAYAEPAAPRPASDLSMPRVAGAMDRLFVDSSERLRARGVLDARLPGLQEAFEGGAGRVETGAGPAESASAGSASAGSASGDRDPTDEGPTDHPAQNPDRSAPTPQELEDAAWRAIVAGWADTAAEPVPRWPAGDGAAGTDGPPGTAGGTGTRGRADTDPGGRGTIEPGGRGAIEPGGRGAADPRGGAAADPGGRGANPRGADPRAADPRAADPTGPGEQPRWGRSASGGQRGRRRGDPPAPAPGGEEERYVPPPPPPLPRADLITRVAWTGLLGGPALVIIMTLAGVGVARSVAVLALAAFVGGFVTLVARMQDRPPSDSGPDDGAVV